MAPEGGQRGASTFQGLYLFFRPLAAPGRRVRAGGRVFSASPEHILCRDPEPGVGDWNSPAVAP